MTNQRLTKKIVTIPKARFFCNDLVTQLCLFGEFVCLQNGSKKKKQSPQIIDFVGFVIRWLSDVSEALRCVRDSNP